MELLPVPKPKKVRWSFIWLAIFTFYYSFAAYLIAIFTAFLPSKPTLSLWAYSLIMATSLTLLQRFSPPKPAPPKPEKSTLDNITAVSAKATFLIGAVTHLLTGQPSWWFILFWTFGIPASILLTNYLSDKSNFNQRAEIEGVQPESESHLVEPTH